MFFVFKHHFFAEDFIDFLFESYVKILEYFRPKFFVFENVTGILSAKVNGKNIFPQVVKALGKEYKVIDNPEILTHNTADYGVPQIRKRVIIMGVRRDLKECDVNDLYKEVIKTHYNPETPETERKKRKRFVDVKEAISDLPSVAPGQEQYSDCGVSNFYQCRFGT